MSIISSEPLCQSNTCMLAWSGQVSPITMALLRVPARVLDDVTPEGNAGGKALHVRIIVIAHTYLQIPVSFSLSISVKDATIYPRCIYSLHTSKIKH
jgi:hypothetical protein